MSNTKKKLTAAQQQELLQTLEARFKKNSHRHKGLPWEQVRAALEAHPAKLWSLHAMEDTGGEPDVIAHDAKNGTYTFFDCAAESPKGRRSYCYDHEALEKRKEHKPEDSAVNAAAEMGIELLTEAQYRALQETGPFDLKTSSWVSTPEAVRRHGGALFCDRRYDHVFVYHNGADSYYAARGFRGCLTI